MHCKNCLAPLSNGDTYCKVCGKTVETNTAYPSNEEIIKAYNEPSQTSVFPEVRSINEQPKPVQSLEQTNILNPIKEDVVSKTTVVSQPVNTVPTQQTVQNTVVMPKPEVRPTPQPMPVAPVQQVPTVAPVQPTTPTNSQIRPEPQPIVNENGGISKKIFAIGIIIAVIATALIAILISIPVISNKVQKVKDEAANVEPVVKTVTEERILFSGYSFLIPEGYAYKIVGSQLIVEKTATKEAMAIQVYTDTLANMKANLTTLKSNLTSAKWTIGKIYPDSSVKDRAYLTVEATSNNKKVMIAYTKASAKQVFGIVYLDPATTTYPTTTLEGFNDIIDSAKENSVVTTTNINTHTTKKIFFTAAKK